MKKVIIIGASSGIGKKLASIYATEGCMVAITGRRQDLLYEIQQGFPQNTITKAFDIKSDENISIIDSLIESLGGLDLFIFCAGTLELSSQPVWEIDEKIIALNVAAFAKCTGHIFNYFINKGSGQIAVISSIAAIRGGASAPAYNASKAFASIYAESLNLQAMVLGKPVVVTDIKPGFVQTEMAKGKTKFWLIPVEKAASQIVRSIQLKKRKVIISKEWIIVGLLMKWMPDFIFRWITKKMAG